jgi:uncharacterized protein with PQ loop repeat
MMVNFEIFGYIGIVFAMTYRIPQIIKIYKNKKGEDISNKTFLLHNCAYIFLLIYISNKPPVDYLIISYYIIGMVQNLIVVLLKQYYKKIEVSI